MWTKTILTLFLELQFQFHVAFVCCSFISIRLFNLILALLGIFTERFTELN